MPFVELCEEWTLSITNPITYFHDAKCLCDLQLVNAIA